MKQAFRPCVLVYWRSIKSVCSHTRISDSCVRAVSVYTAQGAYDRPPAPHMTGGEVKSVHVHWFVCRALHLMEPTTFTIAPNAWKSANIQMYWGWKERRKKKIVSLFLFWHLPSPVCFFASLHRSDSVYCGHERYSMFTVFQARRRSGSGGIETECLDNQRPSATRRQSGQTRVTSAANHGSLSLLRKNWLFWVRRCELSHTNTI